MLKKKKIENAEEDTYQDDIYASFNKKEEPEKVIVNEEYTALPTDNENNGSYLESHTVITKGSKYSRIILYGFYALIFLVGIIIFFMLRSDRYEFYLVKNEVSVNKGSSYQVELTPKNVRYFDYLNYKYEIDDTNVATVDEFGTVTGVNAGTTTLKIKLNMGLSSKKMKINVPDVKIESINLYAYKNNQLQKKSSVSMIPNESITLKAIANNNDNSFVNVVYSSNDTNVLIVDEFGNVTAKGIGTATITGAKDDVTATITINVYAKDESSSTAPSQGGSSQGTSNKITNIDIGTSQVTKYVGDTLSLNVKIIPNNATAKKTTWSTSNEKVATVTQDGLIRAVAKGTAVITVNVDGIKATCTVIVKEKSSSGGTTTPVTPTQPEAKAPAGTQVSATEVTLSKTSLTVANGKTVTFDIKVSGAAGVIAVSSSDEKIAKVSVSNSDCNGLKCFFDAQTGKEQVITYTVTGTGSGTAMINVSLDDLVSYDEKALTGTGKIGILVK